MTNMVPKPITINNIVAKFTVKTLPNIKGGTNYKAINKNMQLLYANKETLPTP